MYMCYFCLHRSLLRLCSALWRQASPVIDALIYKAIARFLRRTFVGVPHCPSLPFPSLPFPFLSFPYFRVHTAALHAALNGGVCRSVLSSISDMRADGFVPNISLYNKVGL